MSEVSSIQQQDTVYQRVKCDYSFKEQHDMGLEKAIILLQIQLNESRGISKIYDNQEECATLIVSKLLNRKIINIMVYGLSQSGKTGAMIALIKNYLNATTTLIPIENICIITGLSSKEWIAQTKNRMPQSIEDRVYHRQDLTGKFINDIKNKKNVLVIMDEVQIAAKEGQTLCKSFTEAGFYDKQHLLKNDVKIVEFTATPDGIIYDLTNWGDNACKIKMRPGPGYTSCFDLLQSNRIFQYKDLCCYDKKSGNVNTELATKNITEIKKKIDEHFDNPRYHIIRTPNGGKSDYVISNFKKVFGSDIDYRTYNQESEINDINDILKEKPSNHIFIFIKERLRCAKTINKKYLGVVYERVTKSPDDAVVIQAGLGRITGYEDSDCICFTNIQSIEKYKKLWDTNFKDKSVRWKSKTTKYKNRLLESKDTFNNPLLIDGMSISSDESNEELEPVIKKFQTQEAVKEYFNKELKPKNPGKRGPNRRSPEDDGYYHNHIRGEKRIMSFEDVYNDRKWGIKESYRLHACYENIDDITTLQFWIIHY